MPCEKYKPALIDAAVCSAELAPAIHAHVATCPSCAAELAQQRFLVGAIDTSLYRQMNAPVPAAMLERIEAHLAQRPQPNRLPRFAQIFTGTLATLAVAAAIPPVWPAKVHHSTGQEDGFWLFPAPRPGQKRSRRW
jgi:anti-sigma factor RsiW